MSTTTRHILFGGYSTRHILFGGYCLVVALVNASTLRALVAMGRADATASHLALVPFVSIALLYVGRRSIFKPARLQRVAGVCVIATGLGLWLFAQIYQAPRGGEGAFLATVGAIIVLWVGGFLLMYGWASLRRAAFPLFFLGFMLPIPGPVLSATVLFLKTGSAETVSALFTATGTPVYREGFVFALPNVVIEVADECSGIRSSIGLLLTSLLAGHLFLKTGWKKAVLVAAVVPLAILKNGIRIVSLSLLSLHVDPGFLTGQLHHEGGIVFFLLALVILAPLLALLGRSEAHPHFETR